jgi:surfactin synthase thioesterase subunit
MKDTIDLVDKFREAEGLSVFGRSISAEEWVAKTSEEIAEHGANTFLKSLEIVGFRDLSDLSKDPSLFEVFYPRAMTDMSMALKFQSSDPEIRHPLVCPITAFEGQADTLVRRDFMQSWKLYTTSEFKLLKLESDHYLVHELKNEVLNQIKLVFEKYESSLEIH